MWVGMSHGVSHESKNPDAFASAAESALPGPGTDEVFARYQQRAIDEAGIVLVTTPDGVITHVNDNLCRSTGYSRDELLGSSYRTLRSAEHSPQPIGKVSAVLERGETWRGELCERAKDGSLLWLDATIVPMLDEHGNIEGYFGVHFDITRRKKDEIGLQEAHETAEAANRAKSDFLANMSHEIRTPMSAIIGFADMLGALGETKVDRAVRREAIETIQRNGAQLLAIMNDILDLSKIEAGKMCVEKIEMSPALVIGEILRLYGPRAQEKKLE